MTDIAADGPDWDWLKATLDEFITKMQPREVPGPVIYREEPSCGETEAIRQGEIIKPILNRFKPGWARGGSGSHYQWRAHLDAAQELRAWIDVQHEVADRLATFGEQSPTISAAGMHPVVWDAAKAQWNLDQHGEAIYAVARAINSMLQKKLERRDVSEGDLIKQAFSDKAPEPGKARLRYPDIGDDQTSESMRQGVLQFGAGCFAAIRNPLAHRPHDELELTEAEALESLAAFSLLARWIDRAQVETA